MHCTSLSTCQLAPDSGDMLRSVHNDLSCVMTTSEQLRMRTPAQGRRQQLALSVCHQRCHWKSTRLLCYAAGRMQLSCVAAAAAGYLPALRVHSVAVSCRPLHHLTAADWPDPSLDSAVLVSHATAAGCLSNLSLHCLLSHAGPCSSWMRTFTAGS